MMKKNRYIKLVFPPFWPVTQPYLSVPSLAAFLEKSHIACKQYDINLMVAEHIFSKSFLEVCKNRLKEKNNAVMDIIDFCIDNIEICKSEIRSPKCLDVDEYQSHLALLSLCSWIINLSYKNEVYDYAKYSYVNKLYDPLKSEDIKKCMEDVESGNIHSWVIECMKQFIEDLSTETDLVGISVSGINQIIPSVMLATMIKKRNPKVKIAFGGSIITRWHEKLNELKFLFNVVDFILFFEGEIPLYNLVQYLHGEKKIDELKNIAYCDKNGTIQLQIDLHLCIDIDQLPTPVFDRNILKKYFSPELVLPLLSSRGCYWGNCAFCDHAYTFHNSYRRRKINILIKDIKEYITKYNAKNINFHDDAISPRIISELSEALIQEKIVIRWSCEARLEKKFDADLFRLAHQAGLTVLFFGLESYVQRILDKMKKGVEKSIIKRILDESANAGIFNHVFFICGFPGETVEEFKTTYEFVKKNINKCIHSWGFSFYSLTKYSPVAMNPELYGIRMLDNPQDLALDIPYETLDYNKHDIEKNYQHILQSNQIL